MTILYFEVDQPACNLWSIFIKLFPEAKVTLKKIFNIFFNNFMKLFKWLLEKIQTFSNFHEAFTDTKMILLKLTQVILMERDSEEVWASSYAGMFAYYREKVCTRFSKSA